MRMPIHRAIVWYLRRCAGAFHTFPYGDAGRYVVLMNERQYHDYTMKVRDEPPIRPPNINSTRLA